VATIACWASPRATATFDTQCAQIADTLRLVGVTAYPLGPRAAYANALSTTLSRLRSTTTGPLADLQSASTPAGQASAARRLATAYSQAATAVSQITVSPLEGAANAAIAAALGKVASGYSQAADAAAANNAGAYTKAGQAIAAGEAALQAALGSLGELGYTRQ
jgi:hypothetical protein